MVTPLLGKLRKDGGTLYTFPSAQKDLARILTNDSYSFRFSYFACLNIPDIDNGESDDENHLDLNAFPDCDRLDSDNNIKIAEHFQNYIFNYETAILKGYGDDDGYDNDVLRTVSERVFFNWLQKVGAINFEYANRESNLYYEKAGGYSYDALDLNETHYDYVSNRTVKYIGNIDVINSVEIGGDVYSEVYLHIPSTVGASYEVRFASVTDKNYNGGNLSLVSEKIIGRENEEKEKSDLGLSFDAIYDDDNGESNNTYKGDLGFIIDFRDSFYINEPMGYGDIMTMNEMSPDNFKFNCILLYYNFTNNSTGETVTNLYGVLFLNEFNENHIERYPKHKTTNLSNGNSFAFKVDIKLDAYPTSNMLEEGGNNEELLDKFQQYIEDMVKLQQTIDIFNKQQSEISKLQDRVKELETLLYGVDSLTSVTNRVSYIERLLGGLGIADQEALTELINEINKKVDNFVKEHANASSISDGYGIDVNTNDDNVTTINSTISTYSLNDIYPIEGETVEEGEITETNRYNISRSSETELKVYTSLEEGSNLAILYVDGDTCSNDLNFYIDDSAVKWKEGQTLKLKIKDFINFNGSYLRIHTGFENGEWKQMLVILGDDLSYNPTIEIICKDTVMNQSESSFIYECSQNGGDGSSITPSPIDAEEISNGEIEDLINNIFE